MKEKLEHAREVRRKELETLAADCKHQVNKWLLELLIAERTRYAEGFITEKELAQIIDKANRGFL